MDNDRPNKRRRALVLASAGERRRLQHHEVVRVLSVLYFVLHWMIHLRNDAVMVNPLLRGLDPATFTNFLVHNEHGRIIVPTWDDPAMARLLARNDRTMERMFTFNAMYQRADAHWVSDVFPRLSVMELFFANEQDLIHQFRLDDRLAVTFQVPRNERWFVFPQQPASISNTLCYVFSQTERFVDNDNRNVVNRHRFVYPDNYRMEPGDLTQYNNLLPYAQHWMDIHPRLVIGAWQNYYIAMNINPHTFQYIHPTAPLETNHPNGLPLTGGLADDTRAAYRRRMDIMIVFMWVQQTVNTINVQRDINPANGQVGGFRTQSQHLLFRFLINFIENEIEEGRHFLAGVTVEFTRRVPRADTGVIEVPNVQDRLSMIISCDLERYNELCQRIHHALLRLMNS